MKVLLIRHFSARLRLSRRASLSTKKPIYYISITALLLSILTVAPASKANADTAGTGSCVQTFTKTGTGTVDVFESGGYCYVAFKNSGSVGSQTSFSWTRPTSVLSVDALVIGGGGGGGSRHGGGGGAGAFVESRNFIVSSASTVAVLVGAGGAGAPGAAGSSYVGSRGQSSSFKSGSNGLTAISGGAGVNGVAETDGGSGGGSGWNQAAGFVTTSPPQTQTSFAGATLSGITFGSAGISGAKEEDVSFDYWAGGGGGGAGGAGAYPTSNGNATVFYSNGTASTARGGNGGSGKISTILPSAVATSLSVGQVSGSSAYFSGGGGGGMGADGAAGGTGGLGGGANGTRVEATGNNGAANTGGGGGGSGFDDIGTSLNPEGGDGGSGVVVIRYALTGEILRFDATNPSSYTSGTTWNDLAAAKNATLVNGTAFNSRTKAFDFDGVNDYVDLPDLTHDLSNGFAVHAVADFGAVKNWERIFEFSAGGTVSDLALTRNAGTNQLVFEAYKGAVGSSCYSTTDAIQPGFHTYSIVVQPNGTCQFYRDGTSLTTTGTIGWDVSATRTANFIGADRDLGSASISIQSLVMYNSPQVTPVCRPFESTTSTQRVLQFTTAGQCLWTVPAGASTSTALVVAGGGGGGGGQASEHGGGGGGAGGFLTPSLSGLSGTLTVTVGLGGDGGIVSGGNGAAGGNGGNSSISTATAVGGGGGGSYFGSGPGSGGSGGGAGNSDVSAKRVGASGSQGSSGGSVSANGSIGTFAAGGGGAGGAGASVTTTPGSVAAGGVGTASSITGTSTLYAGGGGGGGTSSGGAGGNGGGGTGGRYSSGTGQVGAATFGGGGGGGMGIGGSFANPGGSGGSGIVIVSYALPAQAALSVTTTSSFFGETLALASSGGSGSGEVTFAVTSAGTAGCSISGTNLSATSAGTCTVTATKASDGSFAVASSSATQVTIASPLLAYESFNRVVSSSLTGNTGGADSSGFTGSWLAVNSKNGFRNATGITASSSSESALRPSYPAGVGFPFAASNIALTASGGAGDILMQNARQLSSSVSMDANRSYYLSFLTQDAYHDNQLMVGLLDGLPSSVDDTTKTAIHYGYVPDDGANGQIAIDVGPANRSASCPQDAAAICGTADVYSAKSAFSGGLLGHTAVNGLNYPHFILAKITATSSGNDTIRIKNFAYGTAVPENDSAITWDATHSAAITGSFTHLSVQMNIQGYPYLDEVRLGTSYTSVVNPVTTKTLTINPNYTGATVTTQTVSSGVDSVVPTPVRTGYVFNGWNTNADGVSGTNYTPNQAVNVTSDTTLFAKWREYSVTFAAGTFGTGTSQVFTKSYNVNYTMPSSAAANGYFTRAGHTIIGWTTSPSSTTITNTLGSTNTNNYDQTFYPVWEGSQRNDYALNFTGNTGSYGTTAAATVIPTTGSFTIEAWVKPSSNTIDNTRAVIFSQGTGSAKFYLKRGQLGDLYMLPRGTGSEVLCGNIPANFWNHVAVTFSGSTTSCYVNGVLQNTGSGSTALSSTFSVGSYSDDINLQDTSWIGQIDEVRVYSDARLPAQILTDAHNYATLTDTNLIAYYDFNDGTGTTATNKKAGAAANTNLTLNGSPTWTNLASVTTASGVSRVTFERTYLNNYGGWNTPDGFTSFKALIVGGGGGGGDSSSSLTGGGGGSGGYFATDSLAASGKLVVTVGAGGPGGRTTSAQGSAGGTSSIGTLKVGGGGGGNGYQYATASAAGAGIGGADFVSSGSGGGGRSRSFGDNAAKNGGVGGAVAGSGVVFQSNTYTGTTGVSGSDAFSGDMASGGPGGARIESGRTSTISGSSVVYAKSGHYRAWEDGANTFRPFTYGSGGATNFTYGVVESASNFGGTGASGVVILSWESSKTVTFKSNYVGGATDSTQLIPVSTSTALSANSFSRSGYVFAGWTANADGTGASYADGASVTITSDLPLYAQWTAGTNTVTYNSKGGTAVTAGSFTTGGSIAAAPTAPTRVGFTFAGWSATDGGSVITFPYSPTETSAITLYAKWTGSQVTDSSLELSGTSSQNAQVSSGQILPATGAFTLETWFKPAADVTNNSNAVLISQGTNGGRFYLKRNSSGSMIYFRENASAEATCGTAAADVWHHVAITYSSGTTTCFLNGVQQSTSSTSTALSTTFVVGDYSAQLNQRVNTWKGSVDEVRVYNAVRTGTQIAADAHAYATVTDSTLVAYYDFNEGSGTTAYNLKDGANSATNLTLSGSPAFADVAETSNVNGRTVKIFKRSYLNNTGGWTVPGDATNIDVLAVGGGGAGGTATEGAAGGGGGGRVLTQTNATLSGSLGIQIGRGGAPVTTAGTTPGRDGGNTSVTPITGNAISAAGGGGGASAYVSGASPQGAPSTTGYNGGGGSVWATMFSNGAAGNGGNRGGNAQPHTSPQIGGGGGGAGGAGSNGSAGAGGGAAVSNIYTGSTLFYGAGGGGARRNTGSGGTGGSSVGGNGGADSAGSSATAYSGSGGGGGGAAGATTGLGGFGADGIVVIRYGLENQAALTITSTTGTNGSTLALTTSGGSGSGSVSYVVTTAGTAGCSVSGSTLSFTSAGTCSVTATKASADGYSAVSSSATAITVNAATFTVTYDYNSATSGDTTTSETFTQGNTALTLPVPTKTGYTFAGWFENSGFSGSAIGLTYSPTQTRTIYAKWTGNKYSYNANTGSNAPADQTFAGTTLTAASGSSVTAPTGYSFAGWCTTQPAVGSACGGTSYAVGDNLPTPASATVTLYAKWTILSFNVTFDSNSGTSVTGLTYNYGGSISKPTDPTRTGKFFGGWSTLGASDQGVIGSRISAWPYTPSNSDITLYAIWHDDHSLTLAGTNPASARVGTPGSPVAVVPGNANYTWEAWIYPTGFVGTGSTKFASIIDNGDNGDNYGRSYFYVIDAGSGPYLAAGYAVNPGNEASATTAANSINLNTWQHVAVTITRGNADGSCTTNGALYVAIYINGVKISEGSDTTFVGCTGANGLIVGDNFDDANQQFKGRIDQVKIWDGALTAAELSASRSAFSNSGVDNTLRAHYGFNDLIASPALNDTIDNLASDAATFDLSVFASSTANVTTNVSRSQNQFGVTYDSNSATSGTVTGETSLMPYASVTTPSDSALSRTGYSFAGWNTNAAGTGTNYAVGDSYPVLYGDKTLYAKWTANSNTVTFKSNYTGGSADTTQSITTAVSTALTANPFSRTGYSFAGWTANADGTGTSYTNTQNVTLTDALTLYAKWTANSNTVTFNSNFGTPTTTTQSITSDVATDLTSNTFSRTGYSFAGWTANANGTGTSYTDNQSVTLTGGLTLYAKWTANSNTVTFKSNYTGGPADTTQNITTAVSTALTANTFSRTGYSFAGWTANANGTGTSYTDNQSVTLTGALTLHAKWTANSNTVTFNSNFGTPTTTTQSITTDSATNLTANTFTRTGYSFAGWAQNADGTGTSYTNNQNVTLTGALTLYANWTANVNTVTFKSNYTGGPADTTQSITTDVATNLTSNAFTLNGYTFVGWTTNADGTGTSYTNNQNVTLTGALTLHAKWSANAQAITYAAGTGGTGTGPTSPATVLFDASFTTPANTYNKIGYTFAGWSDGSNVFTANVRYPTTGGVTGPVTLTATWTADSNTVTFNSNFGTPTTTTQSITSDVATDLTSNSFSRTGYSFAGWTANADGTGTSYTNSQNVTLTGALTLYAKWTANSNTVTFKSNYTGGPVDTTQSITTDTSTALTANTFSRTGYSFAGWTANANGTGTSYTDNQNVTITGALTLHAKWTANSNTVTFKSNYIGGAADTTQSITTDSATNLTSNSFSRTGYSFAGWTQNADGTGTSYTNSQNVTLTGGLTLYAKWTANSNTVTFKSNYTGGPADTTQSITTDVATDLTSNAFSLNGYTFVGWTTNADGTGTSYTNNQNVTLTGALTLHAKWSANAQNITYAAGTGGTGTGPTSPATVLFDAWFITPANTYSRTGYSFAGWSDGSTVFSANSRYPATGVVTAPVTLTATWTADAQAITYAAGTGGSGTGPASPATVLYDASFTTPANTFSRSGYNFAGWSDGTNTFAVNARYPASGGVTGPVTLTATWSAGSNSVTYDSKGGTAVTPGSFSTGGSIDSAPAAPSRTGYIFDGWTATDGAATVITFPYSPTATSGITLYAKWTEITYAITYAVNGATGSPERSTDTYTFTGGAVTLSNVGSMAKTGYRFDGWQVNGTTTKLSSTYIPVANVTLQARWAAVQYTITYFSNSGGTAPTADSYTTGDSALVLPGQGSMARTGYTFSGWSTTVNNVSTKVAATLTTSAPVNLFALWDAVPYSVTYSNENSTGGAVPTDATDYNIGNTLIVKANSGALVRTGYSFAGWTLTSGGLGTAYQSGDTYTVGSADLTFYPKWTANTYNITYNANGASGTPSRTSDTYTTAGSTVSLPNVGTMVKTGYDFAGWSTSSTGSVHSGAFTTTSDVTMFAIWTIKSIPYGYDRGVAKGTNLTGSHVARFPNPSAVNGTYGATVTLPTVGSTSSNISDTATVTGSTFKFFGWSYDDVTYSPGATYVLPELVSPETRKVFTAQWVELLAVRYALNGGSGIVDIDPECIQAGDKCLANQVIVLSDAPTRDGYEFAGWRNQANTETRLAGAGVTVTDTSYLWYAQWTPIPYEITFNSVGGSLSPETMTKNIGDSITLPDPGTKTGYTFDGWLVSSTKHGQGTSFVVGTSNVAFTAVWIPNRYNVSYNWNGGSGSGSSGLIYTVGTTPITLPVGNARDGYVFDGWQVSGTTTKLASTYAPTSDTLLEARWLDGAYTLTFNNFNGSSDTSASVTRATATTLPTPTRTGFTFDGWYEDANYTLRYGAGGASVIPAASKALTAKWVQNSLTGINPAHLNPLATLNIAGDSSGIWTGRHSQSGTGATLNIPAGALPNGTEVKVSFVEDLTRPASLIENNNAYFTSVVVHWLAGTGSSATVPTAAANKPLVLRLENPAIVAGAKVFSIIAGQVTEVATATVDGEVTITFYDDPEFVVAATKPGSPTAVAGTTGADARSSISWNAPLGNGGSAVNSYTATSIPEGKTCTTTGTSCLITGLTNGTQYTFTVTATNAIGTSLASAASSAVTPRAVQTYSVAFNSKGGSPVGNGTFVENTTVSAPTDPTRSGFNFIGWATTDGNESTIVSFPYRPTSNANLTLYAIWRSNTPSNPNNGGSGNQAPTPVASARPSKSATPKASATSIPVPVATKSATPKPTTSPSVTPVATPSSSGTANPTISQSPTPAPTPLDVFANAPKPENGIDRPNSGEVNAVLGESEVQTIITTTEVDATIEIGDSISVTVTATDSEGNPVATSPTGSVVFVRGASVSAQGTGFKPGSPVEVWLNSDPILLGSGFADSNGELDQSFYLSVDVPLGDHTLVLHGVSPEDDVVTMALGVSVVDTNAAEPQETDGGMSRNWLWALLGAPLIALSILARRRGALKK